MLSFGASDISAFCFQSFKNVKMTTTLDWWSHICITWLHVFIHIWTHTHKILLWGMNMMISCIQKQQNVSFLYLYFAISSFSPRNIGLREIELRWVLDVGFPWHRHITNAKQFAWYLQVRGQDEIITRLLLIQVENISCIFVVEMLQISYHLFVEANGNVQVSYSCCVLGFCKLDVGLQPFRYPHFDPSLGIAIGHTTPPAILMMRSNDQLPKLSIEYVYSLNKSYQMHKIQRNFEEDVTPAHSMSSRVFLLRASIARFTASCFGNCNLHHFMILAFSWKMYNKPPSAFPLAPSNFKSLIIHCQNCRPQLMWIGLPFWTTSYSFEFANQMHKLLPQGN